MKKDKIKLLKQELHISMEKIIENFDYYVKKLKELEKYRKKYVNKYFKNIGQYPIIIKIERVVYTSYGIKIIGMASQYGSINQLFNDDLYEFEKIDSEYIEMNNGKEFFNKAKKLHANSFADKQLLEEKYQKDLKKLQNKYLEKNDE